MWCCRILLFAAYLLSLSSRHSSYASTLSNSFHYKQYGATSFPRRLQSLRLILNLRGGKNTSKKDEEPEIFDDDGDGESADGVLAADDDVEEAQQNQILLSVQDMWVKTPPMTKVYVMFSLLTTLGAFIFNKNKWPKLFDLDWTRVVTRFEFWRILTAFMYFGPFGLNYILTLQFVWTYMAQLEKLNYSKPEDFFVQMMFGAVVLLVSYAILGFSTRFLGHNLSTYLVYIWARLFEGTEVNVMDIFVLRAELLPWFFCLQTFLLEGEIPFSDFLGIVVGHLYHYLTKRKWLQTPAVVKSWFDSEEVRKSYAKFKDDFE